MIARPWGVLPQGPGIESWDYPMHSSCGQDHPTGGRSKVPCLEDVPHHHHHKKKKEEEEEEEEEKKGILTIISVIQQILITYLVEVGHP